MLILGCHLSAAGKNGVQKAIEQIKNYNGNAVQFFVSNRVGKGTKIISEQDIETINKLSKNIKLVIHSPYTLNFSTEFDQEFWGFSLILKELRIASQIGAIGCVIHMGKFLKSNISIANENFVKSIKFIVKLIKTEKLKSKIILETPAGQGTEMYVKLDAFSEMYHSFTTAEKKHIGICIDTCHIFAAGYDITNYFEKFDKLIGYSSLTLIHYNDSKKEKGSCVDRHENIGLGKISSTDLSFAIVVAKKYSIPIILETPDVNKHKNEINLLLTQFGKI